MASIRQITRGLRSLFRKQQVEQELSEEIGAFAEMAAEEKIKRGLSREEALRAVRLESGAVETAREEVRAATWESFVEDFWRDLHFSVRLLRKCPGFTAIVVVTLALGIAANTTVLSWMSATLLNPVPGAAHTSDLVTIDRGDRTGYATRPFSYPDLRDLSEHAQTFSGILGYHNDYMSLTGVAKPERIFGALTTASYFEVLGVPPDSGPHFSSGRRNAERRGGSDCDRLRRLAKPFRRRSAHHRQDDSDQSPSLHRDRGHATRFYRLRHRTAHRAVDSARDGSRRLGCEPSGISRRGLAERARKTSPGRDEGSGRGRDSTC